VLFAVPLIVRASPGLSTPAALPAGNVPTSICYQGTLSNASGAPIDAAVNMTFAIYDASAGGNALWMETQPAVTVARGYFNVYLGDVNPLSSALFSGQTPLYLGVKVGSDSEMTPRLRIASIPYAFAAQAAPPCGGTVCSGSCVSLSGDPLNCGSCGNVCPPPANGFATCADGACGWGCDYGWDDCDNNPDNGCEIDKISDANNCGTCGNVCFTPNGFSACTAGACVLGGCNAGYSNCGGACVNLNGDLLNCGTCGYACPGPANGYPACTAGACVLGGCNAGYSNCGGACVNLSGDPLNCGTCGHVCGSGQSCVAGACQ
jgi:hypothetical protein